MIIIEMELIYYIVKKLNYYFLFKRTKLIVKLLIWITIVKKMKK